ncbi:hypothetical protein OAF48_05655 [Flavobacteriaceae bacterium]|jgi:hypothetical protein|nr:hypothetical protein [Flavobacteriaceae bacterium]
MKNSENNIIYANMFMLRKNFLKGTESVIRKKFSNDLRVFVHNYLPTKTSPEVKKLTGVDEIPTYFSSIKRKFSGKGIMLEHIIEVKDLANKYIDMARDEDYKLEEESVYKMCVNDYKAVYKLKSKEKATGKDAEKYLTK